MVCNKTPELLKKELNEWVSIATSKEVSPVVDKAGLQVNQQDRRLALFGLSVARDFTKSDFNQLSSALHSS